MSSTLSIKYGGLNIMRGFTKRADRGLFHGRIVGTGNLISFSHIKTPRKFRPNVHRHHLYSQLLNKKISVNMTTHAVRCMDKQGGFDRYILNTPDKKLQSKWGSEMRERLKLKLELIAFEMEKLAKQGKYQSIEFFKDYAIPERLHQMGYERQAMVDAGLKDPAFLEIRLLDNTVTQLTPSLARLVEAYRVFQGRPLNATIQERKRIGAENFHLVRKLPHLEIVKVALEEELRKRKVETYEKLVEKQTKRRAKGFRDRQIQSLIDRKRDLLDAQYVPSVTKQTEWSTSESNLKSLRKIERYNEKNKEEHLKKVRSLLNTTHTSTVIKYSKHKSTQFPLIAPKTQYRDLKNAASRLLASQTPLKPLPNYRMVGRVPVSSKSKSFAQKRTLSSSLRYLKKSTLSRPKVKRIFLKKDEVPLQRETN